MIILQVIVLLILTKLLTTFTIKTIKDLSDIKYFLLSGTTFVAIFYLIDAMDVENTLIMGVVIFVVLVRVIIETKNIK